MTLLPATKGTLIVEKIDNNNGYAEVNIEEVPIIHNYNIILHIIKPQQITYILDTFENNIKQLGEIDNKNILLHELSLLRTKVKTLLPHRHKRGLINAVGTGLKWLFGSMDENDRVDIEEHLGTIDENNHNIINNLNKNIEINNHFNDTFNKIKETIEADRDKILEKFNDIKTNNEKIYKELIYLDIILKIKILGDNIEHIQNNIASSRMNLMSSNILTEDEIRKYDIDLYKLQNIRLGTAEYKKEKLIFAIKIPKDIFKAKRSIVTPITNNKFEEFDFENKEIVIINNTHYDFNGNVYEKSLKESKLCIYQNNCYKIKNTKSEIIEINSNSILLKNQNTTTLSSSCDDRIITLNGNYLINFHNCNVKIRNQTYYGKNEEFTQNFVIKNNDNQLKENSSTLSFDDIVINQIENMEVIEELKFHKKKYIMYNWIYLIAFIVIVILFILLFLFTLYKYKSIKVIINNETQESFDLKGGGVMSIPPPNINKIPVDWNS